MEEKAPEIIEEIKNSNEETLRKTIEKWYEEIRTQSLRIGANFIASAVKFAINKNIDKPGRVTMNDYKRMIKDINKILDVQLKTQQNNLGVTPKETTNTQEDEI